jgi:hypothetical protein
MNSQIILKFGYSMRNRTYGGVESNQGVKVNQMVVVATIFGNRSDAGDHVLRRRTAAVYGEHATVHYEMQLGFPRARMLTLGLAEDSKSMIMAGDALTVADSGDDLQKGTANIQ